MSFFQNTPELPADPIFSLPSLFAQDPRPYKVNLGIGVYLNEQGKPTLFSSVTKAEKKIFGNTLEKNYLPIDGHPKYITETLKLIFGEPFFEKSQDLLLGFQTVGGAGALRLGGEFLKQLSQKVFVSAPSWINHFNIFKRSGFEIHEYPYLDGKNCRLDFELLTQAFNKMEESSVVVLQSSGHNPTGINPTKDQWLKLSEIIKDRKLIPFFDLAYQGFAQSMDKDALPIRCFAENGHEMFVAYSFSKNMGLYGERAGALAVLTADSKRRPAIASQLRQMIRGMYSTPPLHGGLIVSTILQDEQLKNEWLNELESMRKRLLLERQRFFEEIQNSNKKKNYNFLNDQSGMFLYLGLTPHHVEALIEKYAIYLPADGRINVAGLNAANTKYVVKSLLDIESS